jgi:hypothetical protein
MNVHISPEKECLRYAEKRINDVDLYYEVHGKGSALMLVAGLGSDSQSWVPNVQDLAQHYQVIIFDNRGTGRTVPHETETSIQQMSDDCVALIKALGLSSVALLGHSMAVLKTIPGSILRLSKMQPIPYIWNSPRHLLTISYSSSVVLTRLLNKK